MFAYALLAAAAPPIVMPVEATPGNGAIETVLLAPVYKGAFACVEHYDRQLPFTGDALGTDCSLIGGVETAGFPQLYRTDGKTNADWYSWDQPVLSPTDGKVVGAFDNPRMNVPGTLGKPPAGMIQIERSDGVLVTLAHVTAISVARGDMVKAGQPVGKVGNNGMARSPHIHIGAAKGTVPVQIRWDQKAMAVLQGN